jgi:hypothetical protein
MQVLNMPNEADKLAISVAIKADSYEKGAAGAAP